MISNEAWFAHTPGLKVVYPSTPMDAKGLLIAAINDPNPVMYFEHKALYRSVSGPGPSDYYEIEIGKARQVRNGSELSIITYGSGVHWAEEYAAAHPEIDIDILDLRTLLSYPCGRSTNRSRAGLTRRHIDRRIGWRDRRLDRGTLFWDARCTGDALCIAGYTHSLQY